jgi:hypothetical protein
MCGLKVGLNNRHGFLHRLSDVSTHTLNRHRAFKVKVTVMSVDVWALVLKNGPKIPSERYLLLVLANYADKEGVKCFPSVRTLAADTCLSQKTIGRLRAALQAGGWITFEQGCRGKPSQYRINLEKLNGGHHVHYSDSALPELVPLDRTPCPRIVDTMSANGGHPVQRNKEGTVIDPSINRQSSFPLGSCVPSDENRPSGRGTFTLEGRTTATTAAVDTAAGKEKHMDKTSNEYLRAFGNCSFCHEDYRREEVVGKFFCSQKCAEADARKRQPKQWDRPYSDYRRDVQ